VILYLDTSSLAKLYVTEAGSDAVRELVEAAGIVATSQVAYAEMRAALARRRRDGALGPRQFGAVKRAFDTDWPAYVALNPSAAICREAGDVAERYRLRGFDSIHLASFAEVARTAAGSEVRFSSYDDALNRAARSLQRTLRRRPA
jgi:predicted nucleic acid-binding protein